MARGRDKRARLDVSAHTSALLECGAINAYYGTSFHPGDLDSWAESDINEAITLAHEMLNTKKDA